MRPTLVVAAALALAACKVGVEGAPCRVAGSDDDCPEGQACGNDGRCSERAAACATRCDLGATRCTGDVLETCGAAVDEICGTWFPRPCSDEGLLCRTFRGTAGFTCVCPPPAASDFAADPARGLLVTEPPFPTGTAEPAACRFARLTDALAAAAEAAATGPATVVVHGAPGATTFGDVATGEVFPLRVPPNVTLRASSTAERAELRAQTATGEDLVDLRGTIEGFRIVSAGATGVGIAVSCDTSAPPPRVANVAVEGGGLLASGVEVAAEACGAAVEISGSLFTASGIGVRVTGGRVVIGEPGDAGGVAVTGNAGDGVVLTGVESAIDARLVEVLISGNGGTGLVLDGVGAGSKLALAGCDVSANGAAAARTYGSGSPQRQAGGVLVRQDEELEAFDFTANRVFGNRGDELAFETSLPWSIAAAGRTCFDPGVSNTFACIGDGALAVTVAGTGTVDASLSVWPTTDWQDYVSPGVTAGSGFCNGIPGTPPVPAACPDL